MRDMIRIEVQIWKSLRLRIGLFLLPIGAGLLLIATNAMVVPRGHVIDYMPLALRWSHYWSFFDLGFILPIRRLGAEILAIKEVVPNAAVLGALYNLAVADAVTVLLASCVISQCLIWSQDMLKSDPVPQTRSRTRLAIGLVVAALVIIAVCDPAMIDDAAVVTLLNATHITSVAAILPFGTDARIVATFIFITYAVAAATTAIAATTDDRDDRLNNMDVVRFTLIFTSVVMLASVVTGKFRWDAALHMIPSLSDGKPSVEQVAFRIVSDAVMNYWAAILSVGLALLYGIPAILLYRRPTPQEHAALTDAGEKDTTATPARRADWTSWLDTEILGRVLRAVAILSPPLVGALISVVDKTAK